MSDVISLVSVLDDAFLWTLKRGSNIMHIDGASKTSIAQLSRSSLREHPQQATHCALLFRVWHLDVQFMAAH